MAKQYVVTAQVNGGSSTQQTFIVRNDEPIMSKGWLWRMYEAFGLVKGDTATFEITVISGPTTVSDPMSWSTIPETLLMAIIGHGISLAFID